MKIFAVALVLLAALVSRLTTGFAILGVLCAAAVLISSAALLVALHGNRKVNTFIKDQGDRIDSVTPTANDG